MIHLVEQLEREFAVLVDRQLEHQPVAGGRGQRVLDDLEHQLLALRAQAQGIELVCGIAHEAERDRLVGAADDQAGKRAGDVGRTARRHTRIAGKGAIGVAVVGARALGAGDRPALARLEGVDIVLIDRLDDHVAGQRGNVVLHVDDELVHDHVAIGIRGDEAELQPDQILDRGTLALDAWVGMVDLVEQPEPDLAFAEVGKLHLEHQPVAGLAERIEPAVAFTAVVIVDEPGDGVVLVLSELAVHEGDELGAVVGQLIENLLALRRQRRAVV